MRSFRAITQEHLESIQLGAGVILTSFDPADVDGIEDDDILCATTGGVKVSCTPTYEDLGEDIYGCPEDRMGLKYLTGWESKLSFTSLGTSADDICMMLGAANIRTTGDGIYGIIPRRDLEQDDFTASLWWVGDRLDGGVVAIELKNALSTGGYSLQTSESGAGETSCEITGHLSIDDQDMAPISIYSFADGEYDEGAEEDTEPETEEDTETEEEAEPETEEDSEETEEDTEPETEPETEEDSGETGEDTDTETDTETEEDTDAETDTEAEEDTDNTVWAMEMVEMDVSDNWGVGQYKITSVLTPEDRASMTDEELAEAEEQRIVKIVLMDDFDIEIDETTVYEYMLVLNTGDYWSCMDFGAAGITDSDEALSYYEELLTYAQLYAMLGYDSGYITISEMDTSKITKESGDDEEEEEDTTQVVILVEDLTDSTSATEDTLGYDIGLYLTGLYAGKIVSQSKVGDVDTVVGVYTESDSDTAAVSEGDYVVIDSDADTSTTTGAVASGIYEAFGLDDDVIIYTPRYVSILDAFFDLQGYITEEAEEE